MEYMEYLRNLYLHEDSGCLLGVYSFPHQDSCYVASTALFLWAQNRFSYSPTWLGMATQGSIFPQSLQNWFVDMTLFIMAIIKHSGILPHMATYGHTESIFPQNLQKWSHIIWNILKTCTFMKIQVVFRSFIASHTRIPATSLPLPFPLGPKQVSYSPTWLGMATRGSSSHKVYRISS